MAQNHVDKILSQDYQLGFSVDIEADTVPPGLNEDVLRFISTKKDEPSWMTDLRIKALHKWEVMKEPKWAHLDYAPIDYQSISYFSAPKKAPNSLDEVDDKILEAYEKLGIPIEEQKMLEGIAVDAVFDSVSVKTTYSETLKEKGIIFCSISEAMRDYPELIQKYMFSTYFRINAKNTGQFERTLIIADEGSYVSYNEGCSAPQRDDNQLHAAVVELIAKKDAEIKYSTIQNWYPGDDEGKGGIYNLVTKRGLCDGDNSKISWTQVETGSAVS